MSTENQPNLVAQMMQKQLQENSQKSTLENEVKTDIQNTIENATQNESQNEFKMAQNSLNTPPEQEKPVSENTLENETENALENDLENEEETADEIATADHDSDANYMEEAEDEPIPEVDDPLKEIRDEPAPTTVGEQIKKATGDSPKNRKNLGDISDVIFEEIDLFKAQICSALSGKHTSVYLADTKRQKIVKSAVSEYLNSQEIKAPSPFGTLIIALSLWLLPSLGTAFYQKYKLKQTQKTNPVAVQPTAPHSTAGESAPKDEPQVHPYEHLKEYQENRRAFSIHKTKGVYNKLPNGTFCPIATAEEFPSPEIQAMLDEGLSSAEIREKIYT